MYSFGEFSELIRIHKLTLMRIAEIKKSKSKTEKALSDLDGRIENAKVSIDSFDRKAPTKASMYEASSRRSKKRRLKDDYAEECIIARSLVKQQKKMAREVRPLRQLLRTQSRDLDTRQEERHLSEVAIARYAGIDTAAYDDAIDFRLSAYKIDIYFGGEEFPIGEGHGHYVLGMPHGVIRYRREPGAPHGDQNFVLNEMAC